MRIVVAVFADFAHAFLGGASQLRAPLCGCETLQRTLQRALRIEGVAGCALIVRPRDEPAAHAALEDYCLREVIQVAPIDDGARPRRGLIRAARKWNLDAWRGSPLGATWFDEFVEPRLVMKCYAALSADGLLCVDGHQPFLDVAISSAMVRRAVERDAETPLMATQAPPGAAGLLLKPPITEEFVRLNNPVGLLFSYRPEAPRPDPITRPFFLQLDGAMIHARARLTADTRAAREFATVALAQLGEDCSATDICTWLSSGGGRVARPPRDVELELTTEHPLPESSLRPQRSRVPTRGLTRTDLVRALALRLAEYDDSVVVLAGHGDPLLSPIFSEVCALLRASGVCGIAVRTPLVELSDIALEALLDAQVDVVEAQLDAIDAPGYRAIHGRDAFDQVLTNIDRIQQLRRERVSPQPIVLPSITRCAATLPVIEHFYDHWVTALGGAVIRGRATLGGELSVDSLPPLTPPTRYACRRSAERLSILANGVITACDQDLFGVAPLGAWRPESELGVDRRRLELFQKAQASLEFGEFPLCQGCKCWPQPA